MNTSKEAYDAAAARFEAINATIHEQTAALQRQIELLDAEWDAARDELRQHEAYAGIPLYEHIERFTAATCTLGRRCRVHDAAALARQHDHDGPGACPACVSQIRGLVADLPGAEVIELPV